MPKEIARIAALCACLVIAGVAASGQDLLTYGITGSGGERFTAAMSRLPVQKLLLDIAAEPRTQQFVDAALTGAGVPREELESLGLIRREHERYVLAFTLFTRDDVRKVRQVSEIHARSLAEAFLARRAEIDAALKQYPVPTVDPKAVAYVLLGCFALDWDALEIAAKKGYRSKPQGSYITWAEEKTETSLKGVFWGSHNEYLPEVVFTSFGDHFSLPRDALPDLLWRMKRSLTLAAIPEPLKPKLLRAGQQSLDEMAQKTGRMMFALREGPQELDALAKAAGTSLEEARGLLDVLLELDYASQDGSRYHARIPVLGEHDLAMADALRRIGREIIEMWLATNYSRIERNLEGITPRRYGISFAHGFTQVWHYVFGLANGQLVEAGLFADPYASGRKHKGFIPVVWHRSLARWP